MPWEVQTKDPLWESRIPSRIAGCAGVLPSPCASLMGGWSRIAVLELYRALLRAGCHLHYTDRNCYQRAVAGEFRRCQALTVPSDKEDALKRGQFFLSSRLGG